MGRYILSAVFVVLTLVVSVTAAWAAGEKPELEFNKMLVIIVSIAVAGFTMAVGTILPAWAMAQGLSAAMNAVGRNPEASEKMMLMLVVSMAMIEALAVYTLVVALIILVANPMIAYVF